jgi:hypothetical protein
MVVMDPQACAGAALRVAVAVGSLRLTAAALLAPSAAYAAALGIAGTLREPVVSLRTPPLLLAATWFGSRARGRWADGADAADAVRVRAEAVATALTGVVGRQVVGNARAADGLLDYADAEADAVSAERVTGLLICATARAFHRRAQTAEAALRAEVARAALIGTASRLPIRDAATDAGGADLRAGAALDDPTRGLVAALAVQTPRTRVAVADEVAKIGGLVAGRADATGRIAGRARTTEARVRTAGIRAARLRVGSRLAIRDAAADAGGADFGAGAAVDAPTFVAALIRRLTTRTRVAVADEVVIAGAIGAGRNLAQLFRALIGRAALIPADALSFAAQAGAAIGDARPAIAAEPGLDATLALVGLLIADLAGAAGRITGLNDLARAGDALAVGVAGASLALLRRRAGPTAGRRAVLACTSFNTTLDPDRRTGRNGGVADSWTKGLRTADTVKRVTAVPRTSLLADG